MHLNANYKAFVAETAAKVAAEISKQFTGSHDVSLLKDDDTAEQIAIAAVNVADKLGKKLEDWWQCNGDHETVMFDPDDSPTTRIEGAIYDVSEQVEKLSEKLENIEEELEREYENNLIDE